MWDVMSRSDNWYRPTTRNRTLSSIKREEANARERQRIQQLGAMFNILRSVLPIEDNMKIPKQAILKIACAYISYLNGIINNIEDVTSEARARLHNELSTLSKR
ncbi:unnamed protein product [Auanema sp. JU1783]|nr:unnamed protein product [Auanema sp. JU1783]